jgi:hypothetical protein
LQRIAKGAVVAAAANVLLLAVVHQYDLRIGPVHLAAHQLFKPLLYLCAALLAAILVVDGNSRGDSWMPPWWLIGIATIATYIPSLFLNPGHVNWTHRHISAEIHSLADAAGLFYKPKADGFYRPIPFLSLWVDYTIFHASYWGYHLQSIAWHLANAFLTARLGMRIGLDAASARVSALLFAVAAVNFEPVLWPAARFDLLATFFLLLALLAAFNYFEGRSLAWVLLAFGAAILCKESAFCFPVLLVLLIVVRKPSRWRMLISSTAVVAALALAARFAVYEGFGGYPDAPHFDLRNTTVTSFFTRAVPVPLFGLNTSVALPWWMTICVAAFAIACCGIALSAARSSRIAVLLFAALIGSLPAANLVNWISASMQNTRYLYMTSIAIFLALASTGARARRWVLILAAANALGVIHNVATYQPIIPPERVAAAPLSDCQACPVQ